MKDFLPNGDTNSSLRTCNSFDASDKGSITLPDPPSPSGNGSESDESTESRYVVPAHRVRIIAATHTKASLESTIIDMAFDEHTVWHSVHPANLSPGDSGKLDLMMPTGYRYARGLQSELAYIPPINHPRRSPGKDFIIRKKGSNALTIKSPNATIEGGIVKPKSKIDRFDHLIVRHAEKKGLRLEQILGNSEQVSHRGSTESQKLPSSELLPSTSVSLSRETSATALSIVAHPASRTSCALDQVSNKFTRKSTALGPTASCLASEDRASKILEAIVGVAGSPTNIIGQENKAVPRRKLDSSDENGERWREAHQNLIPSSLGIFPTTKKTVVRSIGTGPNHQFVQGHNLHAHSPTNEHHGAHLSVATEAAVDIVLSDSGHQAPPTAKGGPPPVVKPEENATATTTEGQKKFAKGCLGCRTAGQDNCEQGTNSFSCQNCEARGQVCVDASSRLQCVERQNTNCHAHHWDEQRVSCSQC